MPPVFGPRSPSPTRLKSCAAGSACAATPSQSANTDTSGPSSSSSITSGPARPSSSASPAVTSASVVHTTTPLPAASPSALSTQGATGSASVIAVGTPAAAITSFANVFEPSIAAAPRDGPNTGIPTDRSTSARPVTRGTFGTDHDEVDLESPGEAEHGLAVVCSERMAASEGRDPRIPGSRMELIEERRLHELPGQGVLTATGSEKEDAHAAQVRVSTASRPCPVPTSETGTPSASSTKRT